MIEFLRNWSQQLIIVLMILIIIEMIIPSNSSYRKYIKVIFGIFLLYTMIFPILNVKAEDIDIEKYLKNEYKVGNEKNVVNTINYDKQIEQTYKVKLKDSIEEFINEKGYEQIKFDVDLQYSQENIEINKIILKIKKQDTQEDADVETQEVTIKANTILLVEDNGELLHLMTKLLSREYNVFTAQNGKEGIAVLEKEDVDLIVSDVMMPEMDGIEALKKIKALDPGAKIIMCSAMGQQAMVIESIQSGAKDFIVKPFQADRVIEAVQKVVG